MNKQEAIEAIEKIKYIDTLTINDRITGQQVDMVIKSQVLDIISQIDEPEKTVVPKFVADWIELCKGTGYSLRDGLEHIALPSEVTLWLLEEGDLLTYPNQETFARAWLFGYEVEQEKLYTVEIPNPESVYPMILYKNDGGRVILGTCYTPENWKKLERNQLTESEIRKDFEWAWDAGFAKKVED